MIIDTHPIIEKILIENYRKKTIPETIKIIRELTFACKKMALSGINQRYPNAKKNELRLRLGAL